MTNGGIEGGRTRRSSRLKRAALAAAAVMVVSSCSGSDGGGGGVSVESADTASEYCDATADLAGIESLLSPESIRDPERMEGAFTSFRESLRGIEQASPVEIRADLAELGAAIDDAISTLSGVGFDITTLEPQDAEDLVEIFERPEVQTASARIEAYDTLNCSGRTPTGGSASSDDVDPVPAGSLPADGASADPQAAEALEFAELIRTTFTGDEVDATLLYAEVSTISELVAKLQAEEITVKEIDLFLQRRSDGVPFSYGDDPELDILWNACEASDWAACDGLYQGAPLESLYQRFAATCGRALEERADGQCVERFGE